MLYSTLTGVACSPAKPSVSPPFDSMPWRYSSWSGHFDQHSIRNALRFVDGVEDNIEPAHMNIYATMYDASLTVCIDVSAMYH